MKLSFLLLFFTTSAAIGQDLFEIQGKVISESGKKLAGTVIKLHNSDIKTWTDECGLFKIAVPKDKVAYLSFTEAFTANPPFYFDARKIKPEDRNKLIVFRMLILEAEPNEEAFITLSEDQQQPTIRCKDSADEKVVFDLTKRNRSVPKKSK